MIKICKFQVKIQCLLLELAKFRSLTFDFLIDRRRYIFFALEFQAASFHCLSQTDCCKRPVNCSADSHRMNQPIEVANGPSPVIAFLNASFK